MLESRYMQRVMNILTLVIFAALAWLPWAHWYGGGVRLADTLAPISTLHPLGADNLGRDLLVRLSLSITGAVLPLWLSVTLGCVTGIVLSVATLVARQTRSAQAPISVLDALAGIAAGLPAVIVAFGLAVLWEGGGLMPVAVTLAVLFGLRSYLEVQDWARQDSRLGYWTAHAALGGSMAKRLWRYGVLGAWRAPLVQSLAFHLRAAVAVEAALSYLGFGVQEPQASFGNMLSSHFDLYLKGEWQILMIIVAALVLTVAVPVAVSRLLLPVE